jgi:Flp pilus assembly protein TadG
VLLRRIVPFFSRFWNSTQGAILVEALIVVPVVTIFAIGIIEFGNVFWERQQLQAGVRDAARYWARCHDWSTTSGANTQTCSITTAQNIAFYGKPFPEAGGSTYLRVPNWNQPEDLTITPATPVFGDTVVAVGVVDYANSPLFRFLNIGAIRFGYRYEQRYIGW